MKNNFAHNTQSPHSSLLKQVSYLGQQWWLGQDLLLVQHQLLGQVHQPPPLQMRLPSFADPPGLDGSAFTPAALMRAWSSSSVTVTLSSRRMRAEQMQTSSGTEAAVQTQARWGLPGTVLVAG